MLNLVDVKIHVETLGCRPSSKLFRGTVNREKSLSQPRCEGILTVRGKVGFYNNSNVIDTHDPNTQGGLQPCMCM